jgi:hypothetical protein
MSNDNKLAYMRHAPTGIFDGASAQLMAVNGNDEIKRRGWWQSMGRAVELGRSSWRRLAPGGDARAVKLGRSGSGSQGWCGARAGSPAATARVGSSSCTAHGG